MAKEQTAEWLGKLIERGEDVDKCLVLLREMSAQEEQAAERRERAAERESKSTEYDRQLRLRE